MLNDKSGNNNHGTLTNGPKWTQGKEGTALDFDGKNDYVAVADSDSLSFGDGSVDGSFTIESWINYDLINSFNIAEKYKEYWLTNSNCLRLYLYDFSSGGVLAKSPGCLSNTYKGQWIHLIVTYDGSGWDGINFYINGKLLPGGSSAGSVAGYVSMENTANHPRIGSTTANGKIDGVKIYNRALSAEEVRYHYNRGGPVAEWAMDEGEGARAFDASGNNNTGVLTNGPTWVEGKYGSALSFDGVDDRVVVNDNAALRTTGDWTRSIWVNSPVAIGGDGTTNDIWTQRTTTNKFLLRIDAAGKWALYYRSTGAGFSSFFVARTEAGVWQNIAAVKSGTSITVYLDGKKIASATNAENFPNDSHQIYFGSAAGGMAQFLRGSIDEVKVYNYARTAEQIMQDYNAGVATHLK